MYHGDDTIISVKIKIRIFFKLIFFLELKEYILQDKRTNNNPTGPLAKIASPENKPEKKIFFILLWFIDMKKK